MSHPVSFQRATGRAFHRRLGTSALMLAALALAACSDSTGPDDDTDALAGTIFELQTVEGNTLPARFEPADGPGFADAVITAGSLIFLSDGSVIGRERYRSGAAATDDFEYRVDYERMGDRLLIYSYADEFAPDTATISGNTITVSAQFFEEGVNTRFRYVVPMVYVRD